MGSLGTGSKVSAPIEASVIRKKEMFEKY